MERQIRAIFRDEVVDRYTLKVLNPLHGKGRFASAEMWLANAEQLIVDICRELEAFESSEPLALVRTEHATMDSYRWALVKGPPDNTSEKIHYAFIALRNSLDHLISAAVAPDQRTGANVAFPFGTDEKDILNRRASPKSSIHCIPGILFDKIMLHRPYKDGNYPLWLVNHAANKAKHERLIPLRMQHEFFYCEELSCEGVSFRMCIPPVWDYDSQSMILADVENGSKVRFAGGGSFYVVFDDEVFKRESCIEILKAMLSETSSVVSAVTGHFK